MAETPIPVVVKGPVPMQVVMTAAEGGAPPTTTAEQDRQAAGERLALQTAAPTTTAEQDRKTASQRDINRIWESTQRQIALAVIASALVVAMALSIMGRWIGQPEVQLAAIVFLFGVANLVTGFYFGRTNHSRSGGIGGENVSGPR